MVRPELGLAIFDDRPRSPTVHAVGFSVFARSGFRSRYRLREGMTKRELAHRLRTSKDVIHDWLSGEAIGRKASLERIEEFLRERGLYDCQHRPGLNRFLNNEGFA